MVLLVRLRQMPACGAVGMREEKLRCGGSLRGVLRISEMEVLTVKLERARVRVAAPGEEGGWRDLAGGRSWGKWRGDGHK